MGYYDVEYERQRRESEYYKFHNVSVIPQGCQQYLVTAHNKVWQYVHQKMRESDVEWIQEWGELTRYFDKDIADDYHTSLFFLSARKVAVMFAILDDWKLEDTFDF